MRIENKIPPKHPVTHNFMASYPLPCRSNLWPGKTPKTLESSGAPSKIEGIKLIKEFTTPDESKIIAAGKGPNKKDNPKIIGTVLFGWRPGSNPAIIPNNVPITKEKNSSNIKLFKSNNRKL